MPSRASAAAPSATAGQVNPRPLQGKCTEDNDQAQRCCSDVVGLCPEFYTEQGEVGIDLWSSRNS